MVDRKTLTEAARGFLESAREALIGLGRGLYYTQQAQWMVKTALTSAESRTFQRQAVNWDGWDGALMHLEMLLHDGKLSQEPLATLLSGARIPRDRQMFGYVVPLARSWLNLPDPLGFDESAIEAVLDAFVRAVLERTAVSVSRDVLEQLELRVDPLVLEEGVEVRSATEEELWEFGTMTGAPWQRRPGWLGMPKEDWKILSIRVPHAVDDYWPAGDLRHAAVAALVLASSGGFLLSPLGCRTNYGIAHFAFPYDLRGEFRGKAMVVTPEVAQHLRSAWPRLRQVMTSTDHFLRLPASRLLDGARRTRLDDAVLDYSIGLEALLTREAQTELAYRFALRGATVLTWDEGERQRAFHELHSFYRIRSRIVHGDHIAQDEISKACRVGEKALREIWWWFFDRDEPRLEEGIAAIDSAILG